MVGLLITATVELTFTLTTNPLLAAVGVVLNVNVDPPLLLDATMLPLTLDDTLKSLATPVVAPALPLTLIVHVMAAFVRCGLPLMHVTALAAVGVPNTTNEAGPFVMFTPPTSTLIPYDVKLVVGVVVNVYVLPLLLLLNALTPLGALTLKSLVHPSVAPTPSLLVIVHVMALPARCGLPPLHDSVDAVVGVP